MRKTTGLNFDWYFKEQMEEKDLTIGNFDGFNNVDLPHTNKQIPFNYFNVEDSFLISSYKKTFEINKELNKIYFIKFLGIAQSSKIYLNGIFLKENNCGYNEILLNVTDMIKNGSNELYVIVDSHEGNFPPFGNVVDYLGYGGIYREVYIVETSEKHIEDLFIYPADLMSENPKLKVKLTASKADKCSLHLLIKNEKSTILDQSIRVSDDTEMEFILKKPELWSPNHPNLYNVLAELTIGGEVLDNISFAYGFREIKADENGFYLNNEKIFLRGLDRHQSYPYVGYAMPVSMQKMDADLLKNTLGVNVVRCSHYMQHPEFLNECDRLGLIVYEEFPGWQYIGNADWKKQAIENLDSMIIRDRNHPSICFFGVRINESPDDYDFNKACFERAKELDPTRLITGTRNFEKGLDFDDVYAYNNFLKNDMEDGLLSKGFVTKKKNPYLITEYCGHMYPHKPYDSEERRTKAAYNHKNIISKAEKEKGLMGAIGWVFADYNTHKDFGSGDMICHHGVMDMFRNPKIASYVYSSKRKEAFLDCSSDFSFGDYDGSIFRAPYVYTNCDKVEFYKNDELLKTFYTDQSIDSHVFMIDDFYGDHLSKDEKLSPYMEKRVKNATKYVLNKGFEFKLSFLLKIGIRTALLAYKYYSKYVGGWGDRKTVYKLIGYQDEKIVKEIRRGPSYYKNLEVFISSDQFVVSDTYDVQEVTVKALSEIGSVLRYDFDPITIETTGNLEVIGSKTINLNGGYASFYVKTLKRESSEEKITIKSERSADITINVKVNCDKRLI